MVNESGCPGEDVEELPRSGAEANGPATGPAGPATGAEAAGVSAGADQDLATLYRYLLDVGVPLDRLRAAVERGEPQSALIEYRLLGDGDRYDVAAIAAEAGLPEAVVVEFLRALGTAVPTEGEAALSAADLRAVRLLAQVASLFGEETVLRFARVMRATTGRVAEAAVSMFGISVEDPLRERGGTRAELAEATDRALSFLPLIPELFGVLFQRHALDSVRRMAILHGQDTTYDTVTASVGFADLVASTVWSRSRTPRELADALGEFERLAQAAVSGRARLVKTIGDEVMFFAPTPGEACRTALDLVRAVAEEPRLPALRAGLAHGRVVALDGDLYGPVVNLAARLVHQAEAGQAVVDAALVAAEDTGLGFRALAPRQVAGFDEPVTPYLLAPT
jgi:adenylate cyclase